MSDARDKLQAAIAAKKQAGPKLPPPPKGKSAPAKKAPDPPAPTRSRSASAAAPAKPEKSKSSFLKKKKKPKQKSSGGKKGGGAFGAAFGKLAKNFVDELKEATSEISPEKLLESAKGITQNIGKGDDKAEATPDSAKANGAASAETDAAPAARAKDASPQDAGSSGAQASKPASEEAPKEFSTVKVQKAPPARRKAKPKEAASEAGEEPVMVPDDETPTSPEANDAVPAATEATDEASAGVETASPPTDAEPDRPETSAAEGAPAAAGEESASVSPTKVKRATTSKKKGEASEPASEKAEEVGIIEDEDEPQETAAENTTSETDKSEAEPTAAAAETEASAAATEPTEARPEEKSEGGAKKRPKRAAKQTAHVSKEEQLVRAFHSLHKILNSEIWNPIATNANSKPSTIFAPRAHFDKQWANPDFRDGLKAASRLASGYTIDPSGIEFDDRAIAVVKDYPMDPQNAIKPHTELITKAIGSKATDEILELVKKGKIRQLLYSVGTRLSTFVPTIEILARIYIGLRKKEDIIPGDRLQIQEEVLMKYSKSPYTEDMGKKARNLSLNYFMDYLNEYGFKLYKDRMNQAPDGQNHLGAQKRRHGTITESTVNLVREWGSKVGVSGPAMMNLEGRLLEMADRHLAELVGEVPDEEDA